MSRPRLPAKPKRVRDCYCCHGTGKALNDPKEPCKGCDGTGKIAVFEVNGVVINKPLKGGTEVEEEVEK